MREIVHERQVARIREDVARHETVRRPQGEGEIERRRSSPDEISAQASEPARRSLAPHLCLGVRVGPYGEETAHIPPVEVESVRQTQLGPSGVLPSPLAAAESRSEPTSEGEIQHDEGKNRFVVNALQFCFAQRRVAAEEPPGDFSGCGEVSSRDWERKRAVPRRREVLHVVVADLVLDEGLCCGNEVMLQPFGDSPPEGSANTTAVDGGMFRGGVLWNERALLEANRE